MDLDKYRRIAGPPTEPPEAGTRTTLSEVPTLGTSVEDIRQKANRYREYITQDKLPDAPAAIVEVSPPATQSPVPNTESATDEASKHRPTKGNRFKSERGGKPRQKVSVKPPTSARRKEASPLSGVKIVFLDDTMREEYIQIAGYLMVKYRIKLTMTAYFCFLHEQAIAQQSDETFLSALARFAKSEPPSTNV
jgi:hypothetical protein